MTAQVHYPSLLNALKELSREDLELYAIGAVSALVQLADRLSPAPGDRGYLAVPNTTPGIPQEIHNRITALSEQVMVRVFELYDARN